MPFTTSITPANVAAALGQPAPQPVVAAQWQTWINDQVMFIQDRADKLKVEAIPQAKIDFVVREVVIDQIKRRDAANDYDVPENYRFRTVADWWPLLGLLGKGAGAYSVDTVGYASVHLPWCSINFGSGGTPQGSWVDGYFVPGGGPPSPPVCSCGADIAGVPIFELGGDDL